MVPLNTTISSISIERQGLNEFGAVTDGSKDTWRLRTVTNELIFRKRTENLLKALRTTLHFDHIHGGLMIGGIRGGTAILEQQTFVSHIIGVAHGGVDAHIGRHTGQDNVADTLVAQDQLQIRCHKASLMQCKQTRV